MQSLFMMMKNDLKAKDIMTKKVNYIALSIARAKMLANCRRADATTF